MAYVVKSLMALVDCTDGTTATVMHGGLVPEHVTDDHLAHLLGLNLVVESDFSGGLVPTFAGDGSGREPAVSGTAPAKVAAKAAWVDYAVSQGASQDEAEGYTKEQLIETYGS